MVNKKRVLIITNGAFPVPATKGGAVEGIAESIVRENNKNLDFDLTIYSIFDDKAEMIAKSTYPNVSFDFYKPNPVFVLMDRCLHWLSINVFHKENHLSYATIFQRVGFIRNAGKLIHKNDYNHIVFENQMASLWALKYSDNMKEYASKSVFHLHNHPEKYAHAENIIPQLGRVIGVSSFITNAFLTHLNLEPRDIDTIVLKNAIDTELFNPKKVPLEDTLKIRQKYGFINKRVILFVGRLIPGKGVKELIQAFINLSRKDLGLLIVGSMNFNTLEKNECVQELLDLAGNGKNKSIQFAGYIEHQELPKYYATGDIVVLPSTCEEAAGLTMVEAICMNRPLITTNMGGIPEYAKDSGAILLENDKDLVLNIQNSIETVLSKGNRNLYEEKMNEDYLKRFSLERYYKEFVQDVINE